MTVEHPQSNEPLIPMPALSLPALRQAVRHGRAVRRPSVATWLHMAFGTGHREIVYDLEVDTTHTEALECARKIAAYVQ